MNRSLFWFRRDLRVHDNRALHECIKKSSHVLLIFIFDIKLLSSLPLDDRRVSFLYQSVIDLQKELQKQGGDLCIFYGDPQEIIFSLCQEQKISSIYTARAHSSYGVERDFAIKDKCFDAFIDFYEIEDTLMVSPEKVPVKKVFSAFYRAWRSGPHQPLTGPISFSGKTFLSTRKKSNMEKFSFEKNSSYFEKHYWEKTKKEFDWEHYSDNRDFPWKENGTTKLSVYLRFGVVSPREFLHFVSLLDCETEQLEKEIAWKEFWYNILHNFPYVKEREFQEKRRNLAWRNDATQFTKWCNGETGYPIVDAAMKQLNSTGFMHGRCRMIVASFLTKDLLIDWRWGEEYFAKKLMDYDEAVNIGNWQWSASVGADPKPIRIFSPIRQAERFDPECKYITKYLPSLIGQNIKAIHNPLEYSLEYIPVIVDHKKQVPKAKEMYYGEKK